MTKADEPPKDRHVKRQLNVRLSEDIHAMIEAATKAHGSREAAIRAAFHALRGSNSDAAAHLIQRIKRAIEKHERGE